jgi:hypothetical protein
MAFAALGKGDRKREWGTEAHRVLHRILDAQQIGGMKSRIFGADAGCASQCCRLSGERSKVGSSGDYENENRRDYRELGGSAAAATS